MLTPTAPTVGGALQGAANEASAGFSGGPVAGGNRCAMAEPGPADRQAQGVAPPLVSVALPVYNAGKYLRMAVASIVCQTFTDWELLIIDDGSTDSALETIRDLVDVRFRIFRDGTNKGIAARLNEAMDVARGCYFARMDADDVSYPERFARQIEALRQDPMLDLVAVRAMTIDESDTPTGLFPYALSHDEICARPWRGFYFPHPTWMGKMTWFRKNRYTLPAPYFCEDQELLLRSYSESRFGTVDEILFGYRIRGPVDRRKLAKTRKVLFGAQWRHFTASGQWPFALLSMLAFIGRISLDHLKILRLRFSPGPAGPVPSGVLLRWQSVLARLADRPGQHSQQHTVSFSRE